MVWYIIFCKKYRTIRITETLLNMQAHEIDIECVVGDYEDAYQAALRWDNICK